MAYAGAFSSEASAGLRSVTVLLRGSSMLTFASFPTDSKSLQRGCV